MPSEDVAGAGGWRFAVVTAVLSVTTFLTVFDGQVVTVALPTIAHDLRLQPVDAQWVITAFVLPLGGLLLLGGRCGDHFGRRRTLVTGLVTFAVGLIAAGLATTLSVLLVGRVAQGIGAALATPNTFAAISAMSSPRRRRRVLAVASVAGSGAAVLGAAVGGLITQALGWRYLFLILAPVSLAAAIIAGGTLTEARARGGPRHFDAPAGVLSTSGLAVLVLAITNTERQGLSAATVAEFIAAAGLLGGFIVRERRTQAPLLRLNMLRTRSLRAAMAGMPGQVFAYNGTVFLGLLYFQHAHGYSPTQAGLAFTPLGAAAALGGPAASRLLRTRHWTSVSSGALIACAAGLVLFTRATTQGTYATGFLPALLLIGFGVSLAVVPLNEAAGIDVPDGEKGVGYGVFETVTHISGALTVAILATVAAAGTHSAVPTGQFGAAGFRLGFTVSAGAAILGAILILSVGRRRSGGHPAHLRMPMTG